MLQTRNAKRPAQAAVRFAVDAVAEGLLDREARDRHDRPVGARRAAAPDLRPGAPTTRSWRTGVAASPGAAKGEIVLSAAEAVAAAAEGRDVILVRSFTEADDVAGFHAARGILTSEGGKASHAALVARGMGRPAVTGAAAVEVDLATPARSASAAACCARATRIAIDGSLGRDHARRRAAGRAGGLRAVRRPCSAWCDELRTLGVRANADTPEDAIKAIELGAEGIGLCRTEHMFLGERQPLMAA